MAGESSATLYDTPTGWRAVGRYALLIGVSLVVLFPIYTTVVAALKPGNKVLVNPLVPDALTFEVLRQAWTEGRLGRYMLNSLIVAVIVTIAALPLAACTAAPDPTPAGTSTSRPAPAIRLVAFDSCDQLLTDHDFYVFGRNFLTLRYTVSDAPPGVGGRLTRKRLIRAFSGVAQHCNPVVR